MKTVEEVRRERLAMLRQEAGSLVALNTKLGLNARDATLSQIINAAKNSRTGTPKQMGSKMARELEQACGKEIGWMDTDPALVGPPAETPQEVADILKMLPLLTPKQREWLLSTLRMTIEVAQETMNHRTKSQNVTPSAVRGKAA